MMPMLRVGLAVVLLALPACQATDAPAEGGRTGTLIIRPVYEPPPPDEPISIGGYGFFATVGELTDERIPFDGTLEVELPAGTYPLTIVTRPQSDVLMPGQDEPEFYEATAECEAEVEVPAGGTVEVVYRATGGNACEITPAEA